jgi:hypothetical protein
VYKAKAVDTDVDTAIDTDVDVDTDMDKAEVERLFQNDKEPWSDVYDSGEDTNSTIKSNDLYIKADNEATASVSLYKETEDKDTLSKASEPGLEAQLQ